MSISHQKYALGILLVLVFSFYAGMTLIRADIPEKLSETVAAIAEDLGIVKTEEATPPNEIEFEEDEPEIQTIDPSIWYPGENILANYTFKNHYPAEAYAILSDSGDSWVSSSGGVFGALNYFFQAACGDADDDEYSGMQGNIIIKSNSPGTLTINGQVQFKNDSYDAYDEPLINVTESDLYFDADGYIRLYWRIDAIYTVFNYTAIYIRHWNGTDWHPIFTYYNNSDWIDQHQPWQIWINIDDLYFTPTPISTQIHTRYHYTSPSTKEYELELENFEYGVNLTLFHNPTWNFESINPTASYTTTSSSITFYNTIPVTYTIKFSKEVTHYYAMSSYLRNDFEDSSENSTIYFGGSYSERSTSGSRAWTTSDIEYGEYLVSFACYIESAPTAVVLQYYTSSWQNATSVNVTLTDCWQTFLADIHPTSADSSNLVRLIIDGTGVVFWDEIVFWKSNIDFKTTGYSKNTISFTPKALDCYQSPPLESSELFNISIIDRTAQSTVTSWNSTRQRSILYQGSLAQKEYEIRVESCTTANVSKSYFTPLNTTDNDFGIDRYMNNTADYTNHWGAGGWDYADGDLEDATYTASGSAITKIVENGYLRVQPGALTSYYTISFPASINASYYTHLILRVKDNSTSSSHLKLYGLRDATNYFASLGNQYIFSSSYQEITINLSVLSFSGNYWTGIETAFQLVCTNQTYPDKISPSSFLFIDYVRLVHQNDITLYETPAYFLIDCEDASTVFRTFSNQTFTADIKAGTYFQKNTTTGAHSLEYCGFNRDTEDYELGVFLPTATYSYEYEIAADAYQVNIESFYLSDTYVNLYMTANRDGSYTVYENDTTKGSGSYDKDGTIISHLRDTTYSALIRLAYKFVNSSDTRWFNTTYSNAANGGDMKIRIHDQSGNWIPFDTFDVYIDDVQLYEEYIYRTDMSTTFNLTICDVFGYQLYTNTSEAFEYFKEIQLTLYSVKVQNKQANPVWVKFQRGAANYSKWIFELEVEEYILYAATYTVYVYYSATADFYASLNGTTISYSYSITNDTAIVVTGYSITDVFNNIVSLSADLDNVNATLSSQIINVNLTIGNVNSSIATQFINVNLDISSMNSTIDNAMINILNNVTLVQTNLNSMNLTLYNEINMVDARVNHLWVAILREFAKIYGLTETHFAIVNSEGLGLVFETFPVYVRTDPLANWTRVYDAVYYVLDETTVYWQVQDWFDRVLGEGETEVSGDQYDLVCLINVQKTTFTNWGHYPVKLRIWAGENEFIEERIAPEDSWSYYFKPGLYHFKTEYDAAYTEIGSSEQENWVVHRTDGFFYVNELAPTEVVVSSPARDAFQQLIMQYPIAALIPLLLLATANGAMIAVMLLLVRTDNAFTQKLDRIAKLFEPTKKSKSTTPASTTRSTSKRQVERDQTFDRLAPNPLEKLGR